MLRNPPNGHCFFGPNRPTWPATLPWGLVSLPSRLAGSKIDHKE
jgi:hypothetical protein